jgi:uncharacterized membrane protein YfcA
MQTLELVVAGLTIGLMLGVLGGGGAIFTAPLLIYGFDVSPLVATTVSLVVVLLAAVSGLLGHHRSRMIRWREGMVFGLVGTVAAALGALLAGQLPERVLTGGFAVLLVIAAVAMFRPPKLDDETEHTRHPLVVVLAALAVGLVTGFFGVGGGFVIVPALVLALGFGMREAAATGLLVISINSLAALAVRGPEYMDWSIALPMAAGAVVGSLAGSVVAPRVPKEMLRKAFAALMVAAAVFIGVQTAVA